jgi:oligo-1,6-glucosidase
MTPDTTAQQQRPHGGHPGDLGDLGDLGDSGDPRPHPWWLTSTVYQIYPRSFCDSNGDGIGDLPGIASRLDHLQALGIDVVWLSPVYASPNDDNGYDISDYTAIHPEFGTMADFDAMLAAMHSRGIRLVMDLVVNHTSDEHAWFQQARSARSNRFHDFYIWADPVGEREPTNWESFFGGSAWEWNAATGEYFLHMFSRRQPELNWDHPPLRQAVFDVMRFWLAKGVDGFRMDVINLISKHRGADGRLPDAPVTRPGFLQSGFALVADGPRLLEHLQEMRRDVLDAFDTLAIGECPGIGLAMAQALTDRRPATRGPLDMVFQFEHVNLDEQPGQGKWALKPLRLPDLKRSLAQWQHALHGSGWNSLYWCNHDQPRVVSRYGCDGAFRVQSAKMLATCLHGLQGTPFVYQGEELGMTNYPFARPDDCRDIETLNMLADAVGRRGEDLGVVMQRVRAKGRDNARTPMQWTAGAQAGFSSGTPWLAVHPNHVDVNAEAALADPDSVFHHHRRLIALRRELPVLVHGRFTLLWPDHPAVFGYTRSLGAAQLLVLCNFSGTALMLECPDLGVERAAVLCTNWPLPGGVAGRLDGVQLSLRPFEAWMLLLPAA